ncbi:MAG: glycerophosphodiester phosphodiesterase [Pseudomonadota bacterium]
MSVLKAYSLSWRNKAAFVPVFVTVRLLSFAVIAPVIAGLVQIAVSLSGQAALTDQDIAGFILSPVGFPVFLLIAGISLIGSIFGTAVMTLYLQSSETSNLGALRYALFALARRLPSLLRFAVELIVRVLIIIMPFAVLGAAVAMWLLGDYDINYYLSAKPREFTLAVAIGGLLGLISIVILISRLLNWAVALHLVLFGELGARAAFAESISAMQGKRAALLRDLMIWVLVRLCLAAALAALMSVLLSVAPVVSGDSLRLGLSLTSGLALVWAVGALILGAVSTGALAKILLHRYSDEVPNRIQDMQEKGQQVLPISLVLGAGSIIGLGALSAFLISPELQTRTDVEIIAHRGSSGSHPENTLSAIRAAVDEGADWVEIDVQETADGTVVVMHDSDFMKLSGVDLKIWDAQVSDLDSIDIGSWFDTRFAEERVPTLAEALEAVRNYPSKLLIELKYYGHDVELEKRTAQIVEDAGMTDQVALMSLKYPAVQKMKALRPDWSVGVLAATAIGDLAALEADFVAVNSNLANARFIKRIQDSGKKLLVWTINDPVDMSAMMSMGVDGIITDEPVTAREVLALRSSMTGAERMLLVLLEHLGIGGIDFNNRP